MTLNPIIPLVFAASIVAQPLVDSDILEPSVRNEVEHALAKAGDAPRARPNAQRNLLPFATNGLSRTEIAIRLVSTQKADGRWLVGTNDCTAIAVEWLKAL